ncbi:uncharacterized protein J7T54_003303 [Emericellopsis cladophorae]|uniref:Nudix hydrolase domain-containing protein n=1 Tax=Emericellopsis cladophorae TaxID=2686198 RepID=A0A9P9XVU9_9HYPO|nr:uncharacterized protein J7T54_003303 [Emericellopsis cladophorae]KAI6778553.1 hypothetical protein J7T54_003303 [Emericellopsis cladophorae]
MSLRTLTRISASSVARTVQRCTFATTSPAEAPLQKRAVVGSFLFRRHEDGRLRVALFKRSDKVNTYQHKYAAISGGVEAEDESTLSAALRELHEETKLSEASLHYLCHGQPYSFVDNKFNYEWSVHPFAFQWPSLSTEPLTLGWEHEGHAWFEPSEVPESEVAAGVVESLRRVWPEGDLGRIGVLTRYCLGEAAGKQTGEDARRDPHEAFTAFRETVGEITSSDSAQWRRYVRLAAWHIWNHADRSVKAPLLTRLLPGLELIETLLEPQRVELAPQFEKLAAMALENVQPQKEMVGQGAMSEEDIQYLTKEADRFFSGLWPTPE